MKLRHQNDILQAIVVPRRGARPGRSPSSLLPRPHWLPSQRLLWTQWGDSASAKFWQICCVHVLINICCRCWVVSVNFECTSQWSSSPPATREWDLVRRQKTGQVGLSNYIYTEWAIFWAGPAQRIENVPAGFETLTLHCSVRQWRGRGKSRKGVLA